MNWLQSLFQHNKAWIVPIVGGAVTGATVALQNGKVDAKSIGTGAFVTALTTAATLIKSPLTPSPTAAQQLVEAVVTQTASNIAAGAPVGTQAIGDATKQVAGETIAGIVGEVAAPQSGQTGQ